MRAVLQAQNQQDRPKRCARHNADDAGGTLSPSACEDTAQSDRHLGMKKAIVALARRLAVITHRIWVGGTEFQWTRGVVEARSHQDQIR